MSGAGGAARLGVPRAGGAALRLPEDPAGPQCLGWAGPAAALPARQGGFGPGGRSPAAWPRSGPRPGRAVTAGRGAGGRPLRCCGAALVSPGRSGVARAPPVPGWGALPPRPEGLQPSRGAELELAWAPAPGSAARGWGRYRGHRARPPAAGVAAAGVRAGAPKAVPAARPAPTRRRGLEAVRGAAGSHQPRRGLPALPLLRSVSGYFQASSPSAGFRRIFGCRGRGEAGSLVQRPARGTGIGSHW